MTRPKGPRRFGSGARDARDTRDTSGCGHLVGLHPRVRPFDRGRLALVRDLGVPAWLEPLEALRVPSRARFLNDALSAAREAIAGKRGADGTC
jgi:hypothetical protein